MSNSMGLIIPVPSVTPGPQYASNVSDDLAVISDHGHTGASNNDGNQITPDGLNIISDLSIQSNNLDSIRSSRYASQSTTLSGVGDVSSTYVVNGNLYYNNSSGVPIQITSGSVINFNNVVNYPTLAVSANHTINASDDVTVLECDTTSTNITITLPATVNVPTGRFYIIKDQTGHSIAHPITINPAGINTIDGVSSYTVADNHAAVGFISDGVGNWAVTAWNRKVYFSGETVSFSSGSTLSSSGAINVNGSFNSTVNLSFDRAQTNPTILQADIGTGSVTGNTLIIQAQNATGTSTIGGPLLLKSGTGTSSNGTVSIDNGSTINTTFTPNNVNIGVNNLNFISTVSPFITQLTQTSNVATNSLVISPQAPFASATGSNRNPGNLTISLNTPISGGSHAIVDFRDSGSSILSIGSDNSTNTVFTKPGSTSVTFSCGGSTTLTMNSTGIGLYATTPVTQPARIGQLTDSTTGAVSSTVNNVGSSFSQIILNGNFATVTAKINAIELALHNLGVTL